MSPRLLALIPLAVGINLALGKLVSATSLPLFLDTVGTVLVACLAGVAPALVTAVISQVAMTMIDSPAWLAFLPVHLAIGAYAAFAARRGMFATTPRALLAGIGLALVAAVLSWPIAYFAFGGVAAKGVALLTAALTGSGLPLNLAVLASSLVNDLLDKPATFLLVRAVLAGLPRRTAARFPAADRALGRA